MNTEEQERKITLDHMIDEKFGEIFFLAKDEFDIVNNTPEEQKLWDLLEKYKLKLKDKCKHHFEPEPSAKPEVNAYHTLGDKRLKEYLGRQEFFNDTKGD